jgi:hypothetical protein
MIVYTWVIDKLECYENSYGEKNVVFLAFFTLKGSDGFYTGEVSGSQSLFYDAETMFTPYDELTEQQVIDWVLSTMGETLENTFKRDVELIIFSEANPVTIVLPLPWESNNG